MADFVAVLRKTIDGIADPTPELRQRVYAKARATIEQKLAALNAPEAAATRQIRALEDAIAEVESEFTPAIEDAPPPPAEAKPVAPPPSSTPPHFKFTPIMDPEPEPEIKAPEPLPAPPEPPKPAPSVAPGFTKIGSQPDALEDFLTSHGAGINKRSEPEDDRLPDEDVLAESATGFAAGNKSGRGPEEEDENDLTVAAEDRGAGDYGVYTRGPLKRSAPKKSLVPLLAILGLLLVIAGGGYAGWVYKDKLSEQASAAKTWLASLTSSKTEPQAPAETANNAPATTPAEPATPAPTPQATAPAATPESTEPKPEPKLTQRLMPDGQEVNPGPANDKPSLGEGTSVAASTPDQSAKPAAPPAEQQAAGQTQQPAALPIGQKAFFYEERSGQEAGTADAGAVVWSVVQESPGNDLPPEPAIKAEVTIPGRGINLRMIIRRNGDKTLPASHLVEMIFTVPEGFPGGSIENVSRMTFKDTEQAPGSPLVAIPAKIADNFFIIAMNDAKTAVDTNMALMGRQSWIDIPIAYKTGRRALITLEKGLPGEKVFNDVLKSWADKAGG